MSRQGGKWSTVRRIGALRSLVAVALMAAVGLWAIPIAYGAAGDLDPTFGSGGVVLAGVGNGGNSAANALALGADDTPAIAGTATQSATTQFLVDRFTSNGSQLPTFGAGGPVMTPIGDGGDAEAQSLALDSTGNLVAAGLAKDAGSVKLAVARYSSTGTIDQSFGRQGIELLAPTPAPLDLGARGLGIDSQGRIVVAGYTKISATQTEVFVARLAPTGAPDPTFTSGTIPGVATAMVASSNDSRALALALDSSDRPVIAGSVKTATGTTAMFVSRFTVDGAPDTGFGTSQGSIVANVGSDGQAAAQALRIVLGRPTVAGTADDAGARKLALLRLKPDGSALDPTFASGAPELETIGTADTVGGLAVDVGGRLVVAGSAQDSGQRKALVARLGPDGGLDPTFGTGGYVLTPVGTSAAANATSLQTGSRIVVAGTGTGAGGSQAMLARYLPQSTTTTPATTVPATPTQTSAAPPAPEPSTTATFTAPGTVVLGEPVLLRAGARSSITRYQWDFDGNGSFTTDTGASPAVTHAFLRLGLVTVGLRITDDRGQTHEARRQIVVSRPALSQLRWTPYRPKPGQPVHFTLDTLHDAPDTVPSYFTWKFGTLAPTRTKITLVGRGGGAPRSHGARAADAHVVTPLVIQSAAVNLGLAPHFTQTFPKSGVFDVQAGIVTRGGASVVTHAKIAIGAPPTGRTDDQCPARGDLPCPQTTTSADLVAGYPITFDGSTPHTAVCPTLGGAQGNVIAMAKNLAYPAELTGAQSFGAVGAASARLLSRGRRAHAAAGGGRDCMLLDKSGINIRQWDFGDGTKVTAGRATDAPIVVLHTYKNAGTYVVTQTGEQVDHLGKPTGRLVTGTLTIKVLKPYCGTLHLNGIPLTTSGHCFIELTGPEAKHPRFRAFTGDVLVMGGLAVTGFASGPDSPDALYPAIASPDDATISTDGGGGVSVRMTYAPPDLTHEHGKYLGFDTDTLHVPAPTFNPALQANATDLLSANGRTLTLDVFNALKVTGAHLFVFPSSPALADLVLQLPHVFTGTAEAKLMPIGLGVAHGAGATGDDADFSAALPDTWIGPFQTSNVTIAHRIDSEGGGWYGGGNIGLLGLELDAPYIRADANNTSEHCGKGGPSGFSLLGDGSFDFAGATLQLPSDITLGPVGLSCLQVSGQADPFVLQGKVGLGFPPDAHIIGADACFLIAIMNHGQEADACGQSYKAQTDGESWFHLGGVISVLSIDLAEAHIDVHGGNNLFNISTGGGVDANFLDGAVGLQVHVDGLIVVKPKFEFQFEGSGKVCVFVICPSVDSIVSSKGIAACAIVFGFEYNWETDSGDVFGGCDLSNSSVRISSALPAYDHILARPASAPPSLGATTGTSVDVPAHQSVASFEVRGAGAAPTITVTDPTGRRYSDRGDASAPQTGPGYTILHLRSLAKTILTVRGHLPAGAWRIDTQPGSSAITGLTTRQGLPPTRVAARVKGRGAKRRLLYSVAPVPGQTVEFFEQGRTVGRSLGVATAPQGSLPFPPGYGFAGPRHIFAIVKHDGMPFHKLQLTSYVAPPPPRVKPPSHLRGHVGPDQLDLRWKAVPGASSYVVVARLSDGRTLKITSKKPSLRIRFYLPTMSVRASIVAVATDGRRSSAARFTRHGRRPRASVIHL